MPLVMNLLTGNDMLERGQQKMVIRETMRQLEHIKDMEMHAIKI